MRTRPAGSWSVFTDQRSRPQVGAAGPDALAVPMPASFALARMVSASVRRRTLRLTEGSCRARRRLLGDELTKPLSELEEPFAVGSPIVECSEDCQRLRAVGGEHPAAGDERTLDTPGELHAAEIAVRPKPRRELGGFLIGEGDSAKPDHEWSLGEHVFAYQSSGPRPGRVIVNARAAGRGAARRALDRRLTK